MTLQTRVTLMIVASMTLAIGAIAPGVLERLEPERTKASLARVLEAVARAYFPFGYRVGPTRIVGHPRGYPFEPARPGFSVTKTIEVNEP